MAIPKTRIIPVKVTDYIQEDTFDVFNKYKAEVTKSRQAQALASKLMKAYGGSFNTKRIKGTDLKLSAFDEEDTIILMIYNQNQFFSHIHPF